LVCEDAPAPTLRDSQLQAAPLGNLDTGRRAPQSNWEDAPAPTLRESQLQAAPLGNLDTGRRGPQSNWEDAPAPTLRESTLQTAPLGNLDTGRRGPQVGYDPAGLLPTLREALLQEAPLGQPGGLLQARGSRVYTEQAPAPTAKQTTAESGRGGPADGAPGTGEAARGGYQTALYRAPTTSRETYEDTDALGLPGALQAGTGYLVAVGDGARPSMRDLGQTDYYGGGGGGEPSAPSSTAQYRLWGNESGSWDTAAAGAAAEGPGARRRRVPGEPSGESYRTSQSQAVWEQMSGGDTAARAWALEHPRQAAEDDGAAGPWLDPGGAQVRTDRDRLERAAGRRPMGSSAKVAASTAQAGVQASDHRAHLPPLGAERWGGAGAPSSPPPAVMHPGSPPLPCGPGGQREPAWEALRRGTWEGSQVTHERERYRQSGLLEADVGALQSQLVNNPLALHINF
jgi:hypothetical protein